MTGVHHDVYSTKHSKVNASWYRKHETVMALFVLQGHLLDTGAGCESPAMLPPTAAQPADIGHKVKPSPSPPVDPILRNAPGQAMGMVSPTTSILIWANLKSQTNAISPWTTWLAPITMGVCHHQSAHLRTLLQTVAIWTPTRMTNQNNAKSSSWGIGRDCLKRRTQQEFVSGSLRVELYSGTWTWSK